MVNALQRLRDSSDASKSENIDRDMNQLITTLLHFAEEIKSSQADMKKIVASMGSQMEKLENMNNIKNGK